MEKSPLKNNSCKNPDMKQTLPLLNFIDVRHGCVINKLSFETILNCGIIGRLNHIL